MTFKAGDRVCVQFDGTVRNDVSEHEAPRVMVESGLDGDRYTRYSLPVSAVKLIEPTYQVGALYMDADGGVFMRISASAFPWRDFHGGAFADGYPPRPLRKLVPES